MIALSLLPVAGNLAGAAMAELSPNADRWRNWALHGVVGVVFAVVAVEFMPRALEELNGWQIAAAFLAGGALDLLIEWLPNGEPAAATGCG